MITNDKKDFQMHNAKNETILLNTHGATLRKVMTADRHGKIANIALSPATLPPLQTDNSYAGAVLAPFAGRIRGGQLPYGEKLLYLSQNEGNNHLHGGYHNLAKAMWQAASIVKNGTGHSLLFSCSAHDGLDGYPGNRKYHARYGWKDNSLLTIELSATTDRPTFVNLSHHAYWNLKGDFSTTALDMELCIQSDMVLLCNHEHLPIASTGVAGTPFDFREPISLSSMIETYKDHPQLAIAKGYNHAFILNGKQPAATLRDANTGRALALYTDFPVLMLYSGGFLDAGTVLDGNVPASPSCAIALEPQELPPHIGTTFQDKSECLLVPDHRYHRSIKYHFYVDK